MERCQREVTANDTGSSLPTGAPPVLRKHFRNAAGVYDSIRGSDEKLEKERGEVSVPLKLRA